MLGGVATCKPKKSLALFFFSFVPLVHEAETHGRLMQQGLTSTAISAPAQCIMIMCMKVSVVAYCLQVCAF